jgi:HME family heavy-metal exporter
VTRFGTNTGGGFVDQYGREYLVRNVGLTKRLEDLANTVVAVRNGQPIFLKQVAGVDFAPRVKRGEAGYNGKPAVIISIQKQPAADTVTLTRKIEAALQDIQRTLPSGVTATNVQFRQATFIETSSKRRARSAEAAGRGVDPVRLSDERAGDSGVHHRHSHIDPGDRTGLQCLRPHHQHDDAGRPRDRDRRIGR